MIHETIVNEEAGAHILVKHGTEVQKRKYLPALFYDAQIPHGRKIPNGITFHAIRGSVKTNMLNADVYKAHKDMIRGHRARIAIPGAICILFTLPQFDGGRRNNV